MKIKHDDYGVEANEDRDGYVYICDSFFMGLLMRIELN